MRPSVAALLLAGVTSAGAMIAFLALPGLTAPEHELSAQRWRTGSA